MGRVAAARGGFAALALLLGGVAFSSGCYPKGQTYGVENVGGIIFAVNPPDAEVVLDDVVQGKASDFNEDRYLKAPSGAHRLVLRAPGHENYARDVYLSSALLRIEATLIRLPEETPGAPTPPSSGGSPTRP
jgi:hypothetical protein